MAAVLQMKAALLEMQREDPQAYVNTIQDFKPDASGKRDAASFEKHVLSMVRRLELQKKSSVTLYDEDRFRDCYTCCGAKLGVDCSAVECVDGLVELCQPNDRGPQSDLWAHAGPTRHASRWQTRWRMSTLPAKTQRGPLLGRDCKIWRNIISKGWGLCACHALGVLGMLQFFGAPTTVSPSYQLTTLPQAVHNARITSEEGDTAAPEASTQLPKPWDPTSSTPTKARLARPMRF